MDRLKDRAGRELRAIVRVRAGVRVMGLLIIRLCGCHDVEHGTLP